MFSQFASQPRVSSSFMPRVVRIPRVAQGQQIAPPSSVSSMMSMKQPSTIWCMVGLIVFVMLIFYCFDRKYNIKRTSISTNIQGLRTNVNSLKQQLEGKVVDAVTNQTGAGNEDCSVGMHANQLDDQYKIDLLRGSDSCCGPTTATHMPTYEADGNHIPNNFMARTGNCKCINAKVMRNLSCRGGNGCSVNEPKDCTANNGV